MMNLLFLAVAGASPIPSTPDLGTAGAHCQAHDEVPGFLVDVEGLKDRRGRLRLELYPANQDDFLQDDNVLVAHGKAFRRVDVPVPQSGAVALCIRAPAPGIYAISLLHDRDGNRRFGLSSDGVGFAGNPRLGLSKPDARAASAWTGPHLTRITIVLNYRHGLFSFRPLAKDN